MIIVCSNYSNWENKPENTNDWNYIFLVITYFDEGTNEKQSVSRYVLFNLITFQGSLRISILNSLYY